MIFEYILAYVAIYLLVLCAFGYIEAELPGTSKAKTIIQTIALIWSVSGAVLLLLLTWSLFVTFCSLLMGFVIFDIGKDISMSGSVKKQKETEVK